MKKIKVFLGAFVNQTNAQNLSCRALAKYLDKNQFEVYTLSINSGNLEGLKLQGVHVFNCRFPVKATGVLGMIWGVINADVVYLPRGIFLNWQKRLLKVFNVKSFKTVRNVIDDQAMKTAMSQLIKPTNGDIRKGYEFVDKVYSMSNYMSQYNEKRWGIKSEENILLPPSDFQAFRKYKRVRNALKKLIFIGNDWGRKGLSDFLRLAQKFRELEFHVVGRGDQQKYQEMSGENVHFHGLLIAEMLMEQIEQADLHVLPSKSEGFPRVWLETAANGLPSVLYTGYGAEEYVDHAKTGFVADDYDHLESTIAAILNGEISLAELSAACMESVESYEPQKLTKQYEEVILELYAS